MRLWTALVESEFVIDSEDPRHDGRFEYVVTGGPHAHYVRLIVDANKSGAHLLVIDERKLPYFAWLGGTLFRHNDERFGWLRESGDWRFVIDNDHSTGYREASVPQEGEGVI